MARIVESTERRGIKQISKIKWDPHTTGGVVAMCAAQAAEQIEAKFMVAFTQSGDTARRLSRLRNRIPLIAITPDEQTSHWLTLCWGAQVFQSPDFATNEEMVTHANKMLQEQLDGEEGQYSVIVFGSPIGVCLLYTSPSPRDRTRSRMPSSA